MCSEIALRVLSILKTTVMGELILERAKETLRRCVVVAEPRWFKLCVMPWCFTISNIGHVDVLSLLIAMMGPSRVWPALSCRDSGHSKKAVDIIRELSAPIY